MLCCDYLDNAERSRLLEAQFVVQIPEFAHEFVERCSLVGDAVDAIHVFGAFIERLNPLLLLLCLDFDGSSLVCEERVLKHRTESFLVLLQRVEAG